jgi:hypothetical protein
MAINTNELAGTWVFNDAIALPQSSTAILSYAYNPQTEPPAYEFNFISNGINFVGIVNAYSFKGEDQEILGEIGVYHSTTGWFDAVYKTINITSKLSEVGDGEALLTWLNTNATKIADPVPTDAVTIEYNNAVIASLKAGQSATLECKDLPMLDDVVVTVPEGLGGGEVVEEWDGSIEVV